MKNSNSFLNAITNNIPGLISYWTKDLRNVYANQLYEEWYGKIPEEMFGTHIRETLGEKGYQEKETYIRDCLQGHPQIFEYTLVIPNGTKLEVLTRYVPHKVAGEVKGFFVLVTDQTQQKQTEKALRMSEETLSKAYKFAALGMVFVKIEVEGFPILKANPAYCTMLGYEEDEILKLSEEKLTYPDDYLVERAKLGELMEGKVPSFSMEKRYVHKDGHMVYVDINVSLIHDSEQNPLYFIIQTVETTSRRSLEESLRQALKMQVIGRLAGGVAHDFNNILAAMTLNLDLMGREHPSLDNDTMLRDVKELAQQGAKLTQQLLAFSRQQPMETQPLDMNMRLANLLRLLSRLIGDNIILTLKTEAIDAWIEGDAAMLDQALMNLCLNARDAMPKGGRLTLNTTRVEFKSTTAHSADPSRIGSFLCISISDTGIGMDAQTLKHIFEPFFTTKEIGRGTGLGLASTHGIIQQHQGWIQVESQPGVGTTFNLFLPFTTKKPRLEQSEIALMTAPQKELKKTILLVEDHDMVRKVTIQILEHSGYRVISANDAPEALTVWEKQSMEIDLLLTDIMMPNGMTGIELAERLKKKKPNLSIILVSGYSEENTQFDLNKAKVFRYLNKPYVANTLLKLVEETLALKN